MIKKFALAALLLCSFSAQAGIVVIANPAVPDADEKLIKKVFLGKKAEIAGTSVVPVDQVSGAVHQAFCEAVLGQSEADIAAYWTEKTFTGQGSAPKVLANDAAVKAHVAMTPGAVGYISDSAIDDSVKVLLKK